MEVLFLLGILFLCIHFDQHVAACPQQCDCGKDLTRNKLDVVWCNDSQLSAFPLLKTIDLKTTYLDLQLNKNKITDISLRDEDAISIPQALWLNLTSNLLTTIPAYKESVLSAFTSLQVLLLRNNRLHHIDDDAFSGLHDLLILILSGNRLTKVVASWFDKMSYLVVLGLTNNLISSFEPEYHFTWPDSLWNLNLDNKRIMSMPPLPVKDCSRKMNAECKRTNVTLEHNNIYIGCRRPEHNKTILKMILPLMSVRCQSKLLCPNYNATSQFFQSYVERPVCEKPIIKVNHNDKEKDLFIVHGEPKPTLNVSIKCAPKYQKQENYAKVFYKIEIRYEAENIFGKTDQAFQFDDDTFCQFHAITENNFLSNNISKPRESHSYLEHLNKGVPLWLMIIICFFSFITALIIFVFVIGNCNRSDVITDEDEQL